MLSSFFFFYVYQAPIVGNSSNFFQPWLLDLFMYPFSLNSRSWFQTHFSGGLPIIVILSYLQSTQDDRKVLHLFCYYPNNHKRSKSNLKNSREFWPHLNWMEAIIKSSHSKNILERKREKEDLEFNAWGKEDSQIMS